ncbi:FecCD family ABC transporter permease [Niallia circulans]|uniref:Iron ABC transporter permease n=1 Tax=Niallia circulans TaxID=1397 RepID=A0A941GF11_NIACI|nr:iron ABC transporter permease [Niallia circulans]MCB5236405.1 iron ABC transporter permease [Niallia circulans]
MKKYRLSYILIVLCLLIIVISVLSLKYGAVQTSIIDIIQELKGNEGLVVKYRLPRIILAALVGINMALSGAILQNITKNPLAAPDIMGVTAGSGLIAIIILLLFPTLSSFIPFFAFLGAIVTAGGVYLLSQIKGEIKPLRLALTGVALSAGFNALITFLIVKYALNSSQALVWLKGSLYARSWQHIELIIPWTIIGSVILIVSYRYLNIMQLNEETAVGLGLKVNKVRIIMLLVAVGLAASAVAVAGTIGFIGLVVPPLARLLVGGNSLHYLPVSALMGALLVITADFLGRVIFPPLEIPAGIITAMIGAPYFIYLILTRKSS